MKKLKIPRAHLFQGFKIALGATAAIILAELLHLQYAATAGIIAVLSIMGTKRETLRIALGRLMAYGAALLIAWGCFSLLGYRLIAFAVYLCLFAALCGAAGWTYAIAMVSVLITHFMAAGNMALPMIVNETLLFAIGTLCGIAANLHLYPDEAAMRRHLTTVDELMRAALHALGRAPTGLADAKALLPALQRELTATESLAVRNADNTLWGKPLYALRYVQMRSNQRKVLSQMCAAMADVRTTPAQQETVGALFCRVAEEYRMNNDVSELLSALDAVISGMRTQPLPEDRAEFESRAVLYYVLLRLQDFLQLKAAFYAENGAHP